MEQVEPPFKGSLQVLAVDLAHGGTPVVLVAQQHDLHRRRAFLADRVHPALDAVERLPGIDVVDDDDAVRLEIMLRGDGTVTLLARGVPDLERNRVLTARELPMRDPELHPHGRQLIRLRLFKHMLVDQLGLADPRISDHDNQSAHNFCRVSDWYLASLYYSITIQLPSPSCVTPYIHPLLLFSYSYGHLARAWSCWLTCHTSHLFSTCYWRQPWQIAFTWGSSIARAGLPWACERGRVPATISCRITPRLQTSTLLLMPTTRSTSRHSGGRYQYVPCPGEVSSILVTRGSISLHNPKSSSFTRPRSRMIFWGLRSQWITMGSCEDKQQSAWTICSVMSRASGMSILPRCLMWKARSYPLHSSITINVLSCSTQKSFSFRMFGCCSWLWVWYSRSMCFMKVWRCYWDQDSFWLCSFRAWQVIVFRLKHLQTQLLPPLPISCIGWYSPAHTAHPHAIALQSSSSRLKNSSAPSLTFFLISSSSSLSFSFRRLLRSGPPGYPSSPSNFFSTTI